MQACRDMNRVCFHTEDVWIPLTKERDLKN